MAHCDSGLPQLHILTYKHCGHIRYAPDIAYVDLVTVIVDCGKQEINIAQPILNTVNPFT